MKSNNLLVIASYPPKGETHHKNIVGGASYTKNTLLALSTFYATQKKNIDITVLAEQFDNKRESYKEKEITIERVWKRNALNALPILLIEILFRHKNKKQVLLELELAMFGEKFSLIMLPLFLLLLRIFGKKVTIVIHQVVGDLEEVSGHIDMEKKGLKISVFSLFMAWFYALLLVLSTKIIVFEEEFRKRLVRFGSKEKIVVIPHGVEHFDITITKEAARKSLGIPSNEAVILYFGFLAWYKGVDWLIEQIPQKQKEIMLIVAGGANPNHRNKKYYQTYVKNVQDVCREKGIRLTGFISEEQIPTYFAAADLIVFPYRTLMSSSGPLSMAFSFKKPIFLSSKLNPMFDTLDIHEALKALKLNKDDIMFNFTDDFIKKCTLLLNNKQLLTKTTALSTMLAQRRSWEYIGEQYEKALLQ